jgi:nitroreductase
MDVIKAIKERREITSFKENKIPQETLDEILDAGYLSPTGNNLPSRELILVTKRELLNTLEKTTPFMPWLKEAASAIVITGRPSISKYWIQDASITSGFIWLRATELGIGVGFGAVYHHEDQIESEKREQWVRQTLNLPTDRRIVAILGLGYPNKIPAPKNLPPKEDIIFGA